MRKAQVFTITTIYGDFARPGYSRAKFEGDGQSFWVSDPTRWEVVTTGTPPAECASSQQESTPKGGTMAAKKKDAKTKTARKGGKATKKAAASGKTGRAKTATRKRRTKEPTSQA